MENLGSGMDDLVGMRSSVRPIAETRLLFRNAKLSPLGGISACGLIRGGVGVLEPTRVLGTYALVYVTFGGGSYRTADAALTVSAGDLMIVLPNVGHWYGPEQNQPWDEVHIVFEGAVFDSWRSSALLDPSHPILRLEPIDYWLRRIVEAAGTGNGGNARKALQEVIQLQQFLTDAVMHGRSDSNEMEWLSEAKGLIGLGMNDRTVAEGLGLTYETFRKRFAQLAGYPPGEYRGSLVIAEACRLLSDSDVTIREVSRRLGFSDEFYFSRRFKKAVGLSPNQFRQRHR